MKKDCDYKIHACNSMNFRNNINEVIKAVLNSLFFLPKDFTRIKKNKSTKRYKDTQVKAQNANKWLFFP